MAQWAGISATAIGAVAIMPYVFVAMICSKAQRIIEHESGFCISNLPSLLRCGSIQLGDGYAAQCTPRHPPPPKPRLRKFSGKAQVRSRKSMLSRFKLLTLLMATPCGSRRSVVSGNEVSNTASSSEAVELS